MKPILLFVLMYGLSTGRAQAHNPERPLTEKQIQSVQPITDELALRLYGLRSKYPELMEFQPDRSKYGVALEQRVGFGYCYHYDAAREKSGGTHAVYGEDGVTLQFFCEPIPPPDHEHQRRADPLGTEEAGRNERTLQNLGLVVRYAIETGSRPSTGLVQEVTELFETHLRLLREKDRHPARPAASEEFLKTAEGELGSFGFSINYYTDGRQGILLTRVPPAGVMFENQVVIDADQAHRILQYLAQSGLLDTFDPHPRDDKLGGWNAGAGTISVQAYWHLGIEPDAPLEAETLMGVRSVLHGKASEAWDRFLQRLKGPETANARPQQDALDED